MKALEGLFIHYIWEKNRGYYQGHIKAVDNGMILVQLFSWLDGRPTNMAVLPKSLLMRTTTKLYDDEETWREAGNSLGA